MLVHALAPTTAVACWTIVPGEPVPQAVTPVVRELNVISTAAVLKSAPPATLIAP